jgi:uncharacterized protein (DUF39 family)
MNDLLQAMDSPATLRHARINAFDGERFGVVSAEGHRYWLKPALGCLLQPVVGDGVLISLAGDAGYILSVLERSQPHASELRIDGDVHLSVPGGALSIETRDGIALSAGSTLAVQAQHLVTAVTDAELALGTLKVCGERSDSQWIERHESTVRHTEQAVRHSAEYGDSTRRVEGHEDLSARSVRQHVEKDWSLRGETLDLFAQVTVALNGERIKLG